MAQNGNANGANNRGNNGGNGGYAGNGGGRPTQAAAVPQQPQAVPGVRTTTQFASPTTTVVFVPAPQRPQTTQQQQQPAVVNTPAVVAVTRTTAPVAVASSPLAVASSNTFDANAAAAAASAASASAASAASANALALAASASAAAASNGGSSDFPLGAKIGVGVGAGAAILALLALAACCIRRRRSNHLRDIDPDDTDEWDGAAPDMFVKRSNSALGFTPQHGAVEHKETGMHSAVTAAPVAYNRPAARASLPSITTTPAQMMAPPQPPSVSSYHSLRDQHFAQQRPLSYVHSESAPSYRTEFGQQQQPMREAEAEHPAMAQRQSMLSLNGYNDAPPNGRPVSMTLQRAMDAAARRSVNYESYDR